MKKRFFVIPLLATICFPLLCSGKEVSSEARAYRDAVIFLKGIRQAYITNNANARAQLPGKPAPKVVEGPSDVIWTRSIAILARSHRPDGSRYLARLVFFQQDGSYGEDFGCAVWRRGKTHPKEFLKYLREARDNYETMSPCLAPKFKEEKGEPLLQCLPRDEYVKFVQMQSTPSTRKADAEAEADCSHMLK
jgi:hypothetical protein